MPVFHDRSGITPIVATVLLLLMIVAMSGAVFTFMMDLQERAQDDLLEDMQTRISTMSLNCETDEISFRVRNTGDRNIDASSVDILIYDQQGSLTMNPITEDWSDKDFTEAGASDRVEIDLPQSLVEDDFYLIDLQFPMANEDVRVGGCLAG